MGSGPVLVHTASAKQILHRVFTLEPDIVPSSAGYVVNYDTFITSPTIPLENEMTKT